MVIDPVSALAAMPVLDVVSIEWPDEDTPCTRTRCSRTAVWWDECRACGRPAYRCEPCRRATDASVEARPTMQLVCKRCKAHLPRPIPWKPLR